MVGARYARESIAKGSQSFAAASRLLPPELRDDVARLYAWCRHCDDVIDGQVLGHCQRVVDDPQGKLAALTAQTDAALDGTRTGESVFDGFGAVARAHGITKPLAHDLLRGFAQDVAAERYRTLNDLAVYCYGVAGAVGVMMALVVGVRPDDHDTLDRASDLGLAFQMTNISRDVVADAAAGRIYLPLTWLVDAGVQANAQAVCAPKNADAVFGVTVRLIEAANIYYCSADVGIARLPFRVAWAIAAASRIYRAIGMRRREGGAALLAERARTTHTEKFATIATSAFTAMRGERKSLAYDRSGLWQRPARP